MAIVSETWLPNVNGVTNSVRRAADHLVRNGHEVHLVGPGPGPDHYQPDGAGLPSIPVLRVDGFSPPGYRELNVAKPARAALDAFFRSWRPDVVHVAAPTFLGATALKVTRDLGLPSVAIFQTDMAGFARRYHVRADRLIWARIRTIHERADLTLAPSTHSVWQLRTAGVQRVARWARGVDHEVFDPERRSDELRSSWGADDGTVVVGTVGRLAREKRIDLLRHLAGLAGIRVVVVGDGPARESLQKALPDAHFHGFHTGAALGAAVASLDVFVHLGEAETFCQAIQEAMACAVPVVAPAAGGPLDLVRHGATGYVFPAHQPQLIRGIVAMLAENPDEREEMGRTAHKLTAGRTWDSLGEELIQHYRSVLA